MKEVLISFFPKNVIKISFQESRITACITGSMQQAWNHAGRQDPMCFRKQTQAWMATEVCPSAETHPAEGKLSPAPPGLERQVEFSPGILQL